RPRAGTLPTVLLALLCAILSAGPSAIWAADPSGMKPVPPAGAQVIRLSLDEAVALFLRQNLSLLITRFGIDSAKGQQITAALFPNPVALIGTLASFTGPLNPSNRGQLGFQVQQLFELAGKRGYRIESAGFGTRSAEADFEDAVRQLGFTTKDAY